MYNRITVKSLKRKKKKEKRKEGIPYRNRYIYIYLKYIYCSLFYLIEDSIRFLWMRYCIMCIFSFMS